MLKYRLILTLITNLLFIIKISAQDFKGKATTYPAEAYGDTTSSGEILNAKILTASHEYFPIGSLIELVNLRNKKTIQVIINDNEVYDEDLTLEFTDAVAQALEMKKHEIIDVRIMVISWGKTTGNIAINAKKEPEFKVDFRKYDYVKPTESKKN
ncbi:septal ring lytic transglycosylase RlpA family protein [Arcicella sp. LKC2W]|uniref:septal ring lytic transglycosylase RlpA family protein n=1 Tax=Arcicella sp. LKC2W TaxID=2984198 RepID=UPI002B1F751E|nr:septal ring lytic transglycosylase RlpA family protein [Arcicella sp. LKC2W]MEA5457877.1 septal ring lytic transglycosylase RlpA family protein [Arcicella sp. LKC2W]